MLSVRKTLKKRYNRSHAFFLYQGVGKGLIVIPSESPMANKCFCILNTHYYYILYRAIGQEQVAGSTGRFVLNGVPPELRLGNVAVV